jgi:alpha-tubulin suppressor-like RCC1 family protein
MMSMQQSLLSRSALLIAAALLSVTCGDATSPNGPSQLGITLNQVSITAGAPFSIQVAIQDPTGNTVTTSTAAVTIALGASPGSGPPATLLGDVTVNAVGGVATFSDLHITKAAQGYTITATSAGLPLTTSDGFQIVPDAATDIGFISQPASVSAGVPFSIQVAAQDQFDNVVTNVTGGVTLTLETNPGSATLSGTRVAAFSQGIASFADLTLDKVASGYTISAASGSFSAATSSLLTVIPGIPAKLAFGAIGSTYQSAAFIGGPLRVRILDAHDNHVTTATNAITLSIGTNPGSGTLSVTGGATRTAANGQVDFPGVSVDKVGVGYTLVASATGLQSGTSTSFAVTPGNPSRLAWLDQPAANAHAGVIIPAVRIALHDAAGNVVNDQAGYFIQLSLLSGPPGGKLVTFGASGSPIEGIATFNTIRFSRAGSYTIRATSGLLTHADASPVSVQLAFSRVTVGGGPAFSFPITQARHACSLSTMGALHCWGGSIWGAMGIETSNAQASVLEPELVVTTQLFKDVEAGNLHTCAVTMTGTAFCWGSNLNGRLGDGDPQMGTKATPVAVSGGLHFVSISAGDNHTCGVTSSGAGVLSGPAYCWGSNSSGQLGDGTFGERLTPTLVSGGHSFIAVSASHGAHTCGITTDFLAYCWGLNLDGQLGDASTTTRNVPTLVQNAATHLFRSITTGRFHTCAVQADNAAYCWGGNTSQQLGDGNTDQSDRTAPSLVTATVSAVTGGWLHTCGIGGGTALCWGANDSGQLGDGGTTERNAPAAVSGSLNITQVAAGQDFSCGVTADNRIYCWGLNEFGQLGDNTTTQRLAPVRVLP